MLAAGLLVEYIVFPQLAGARKTLHLIGGMNVGLVVVAFGLEGAALLAYAALTSSLLPVEGRPSRWRVLRINLTTLAVSHVVPGGSAAAGAVGFELLGDAGVAGPDAGFALATQALGSAVVLNVLLWAGLVVSIPARGFNPLYATAALLGAVVIAAVAAAVVLLTRGEQRAARLVCAAASRAPFLDAALVEEAVHRVAARLRTLSGDRTVMSRAVGWAAANWIADAAALWVSLAAFGHPIGPAGLIVAYGLANVTAAVPLTPGGLGVMEAVLTTALVGFGAPRGVAILGVVTWRLVNFWLPIPVGGAAYLSLRLDGRAGRGRGAGELERLPAGGPSATASTSPRAPPRHRSGRPAPTGIGSASRPRPVEGVATRVRSRTKQLTTTATPRPPRTRTARAATPAQPVVLVVVIAGAVPVVVDDDEDGGGAVVVVVAFGRTVAGVAVVVGGGSGAGGAVVGVTSCCSGGDGAGSGAGSGAASSGGGAGGGAVSPRRWRWSSSGDAAGSGLTGTPARAVRMRSPKMAAGKLPPVTDRPWTSLIGRAGS